MVNHDNKLCCTELRCFKCRAKLEKSAFFKFSSDTNKDGFEEEDRKTLEKEKKKKHSYYYCPCCLKHYTIVNSCGYRYSGERWEKIKIFEYNPSRRDLFGTTEVDSE